MALRSPALSDLEIGVMFRAGDHPLELIRDVKSYGVRCGQLGIPGAMPLHSAAETWTSALAEEPVTIVTVFCSFTGQSYADIPTARRTIGFVPPITRIERERRALEVSDFARSIGVPSLACHIGFIPDDPLADEYQALLAVVRRIADHAALNGQTFCLETGQEPALSLLNFLLRTGRSNVGVNFDPANMVLYGMGDPIEALEILAPHVLSVHAKDGTPGNNGALGAERILGEGAVGIESFITALKDLGYRGTIHVEHEVSDPQTKRLGIRSAVDLLRRLI